MIQKESELSGDSEAPVESGGADRDAGVDGSDQDHLEDHQEQRQGPPVVQTSEKGTQKTVLKRSQNSWAKFR